MKTWYPPEFEEFWKAYKAPPNASKPKAFEAYKKAKDLPNLPLLLQCVEAYKQFLKETTTSTFTPAKCHPVTWLNQARYEGFLAKAEKTLEGMSKIESVKDAEVAASALSWPGPVLDKLRMEDAAVKAWILPCTFKPGSPPVIICPTKMHANWLNEKLIDKITRAVGQHVRITYPS